MDLSALGWSDFFADAFRPHQAERCVPARVAVEHRSRYVLYGAGGELSAEPSGRLRYLAAGHAELPAVGDWVAARARPAEGQATIHAVLPRRTQFVRRSPAGGEQVVAANVDVVFLVTALGRDLNPRRVERYLTLAWESGARPVVLLTKADLCDDPAAGAAEIRGVAFGVPVHVVSSVTGEGVGELEPYLAPGSTCALLGSSGVGKSTLVNRLAGRELLRTAAVREGDERGRHTTTHRELVPLPGGALLLDTPGMRELQLTENSEGLGQAFEDVEALAAACRFADCGHEGEPGCAVLEAVERGELDVERLESWRKLSRELRYLDLRDDKAARAEENRKVRNLQKAFRAFQKDRPA